MKLKKKTTAAPPTKPTTKKAPAAGRYVEAREHFDSLKPLSILDFPRSYFKCSKDLRPFISSLAKRTGVDYTTFALPKGEILVLRYSMPTTKLVAKPK